MGCGRLRYEQAAPARETPNRIVAVPAGGRSEPSTPPDTSGEPVGGGGTQASSEGGTGGTRPREQVPLAGSGGEHIDAGTAGGGAVDGGTVDEGTVDSGTAGEGAVDGGTADEGAVDGGTADEGAVDAGIADEGASDASTDAGAPNSDTGTGKMPCLLSADPLVPSTPTPQADFISNNAEANPSFQPDGSITFSRQRPDTTWELYSASETATGYGDLVAVTDFGFSDVSIHFSVAANGLHGLISWHEGDASSSIFAATRSSTNDSWTRGARVSVSTARRDWDPWLSRDGLRVYFSSEGHGSPSADLFMARRPSVSDPFEVPQSLTSLNSDFGEGNPSLTADELAIVFSSRRSGDGNIYYALRAAPDDAFGSPRGIPVVNTNVEEWEPSISGDGCQLLFLRNGAMHLSHIAP